jgi:hypothetical protein
MDDEKNVTTNKGADRSVSTVVSVGKDSVSLLRDLFLFLLAMLLLVFPTRFNDVLTKAGFEEGSIVGLKWRAKLLDSNNALNEAHATITDLQAQLQETTQALKEAQAKPNDPNLNNKISQLEQKNVELNAATASVANTVANTLTANEQFVERAQNTMDTGGKWGVVFGGDATLEGAMDEIKSEAPRYGINGATIYHRQGSFRSVLVQNSRDEAQAALAKAKQRRSDSYVVNISNWCPNAVQQNDSLTECQQR